MIQRLAAIAISCIIITSLLASARAAIQIGDHIRMTDGPGSPGGIFRVEDLTPPLETTFDTFCVEIGEFVTIPGTYVVDDISGETADGGVYGVKSLTDSAAWLYYQYRAGDLGASFDAAYSNSDSRAANALQRAIWLAMSYASSDLPSLTLGTNSSINYLTLSNNLLSAAISAVGGGWENRKSNSEGFVQIMNLGKLNVHGTRVGNAQDQLVLLPTPEPLSVVVWSLLFASAVGARRSRESWKSYLGKWA